MSAQHFKFYLGVDLAKAKLDVHLLPADSAQCMFKGTFPNSPSGLAKLLKALSTRIPDLDLAQLHCTCEATNVYGRLLENTLATRGIACSAVNPAQIKHFGKSLLARTKTDRADARIIARFGQERQPPLTRPLTEAQLELRELMRELEALIDQRTARKNQLATAHSQVVRASIELTINQLTCQIGYIEKLAIQRVLADATLKAQLRLLCTIPGIAQRTALRLLAELAGRTFHSARQLAAYAGLTPQHRQSGTSIQGRTRLCKTGNARLRTALYLPAQSARRWCTPIRAWADTLALTHQPKAVIGAVMRKLIHIVYGVLTHQAPFDPQKAAIPQISY